MLCVNYDKIKQGPALIHTKDRTILGELIQLADGEINVFDFKTAIGQERLNPSLVTSVSVRNTHTQVTTTQKLEHLAPETKSLL